MSNMVKGVVGILVVIACVWGTLHFSPFQSCIRGKLSSGAAVDKAQAAQMCMIP